MASSFRPFPLPSRPGIPAREYHLPDFGGVGDGRRPNSSAFAAAIAAASAAGGGRVIVPEGRWLTGPIHLRSRIELHLDSGARVVFSQLPADYLPVVLCQRGGVMLHNYSPFLYAYGCEDIAITGTGILDGQGEAWWPWKNHQPQMANLFAEIPFGGAGLEERVFGTVEAGIRPVFCQPIECDRVLIEGVTFRASPSWTIQPVWCREVTVRRVTVLNPPSPLSANTDGIDPDACHGVLIEHCHISTGDDAICLKAGRGPDAWKDGRPLENVLIRHCRIGCGHGGITIGSEISGGVRNVHAHDCILDGTDSGIRIKSMPTRGGYIEDILIERVRMRRIQKHALDINLHYDGNPEETMDRRNLRAVPRCRNLTVRDLWCESAAKGIRISGLPGYPIERVTLEGIRITALEAEQIAHATDLRREGVQVSLPHSTSQPTPDPPRQGVACTRWPAAEVIAPAVPFPAGKRPLGRRRTVPITHCAEGEPTVLRWSTPCPFPGGAMILRLAVSVDHRREHRVRVANARSGEAWGNMEILFPSPGQVFEFPLSPGQAAAAHRDGLALSLEEEADPLWIIVQGGEMTNDAVVPHLFCGQEACTEEDFLRLFCSPASLQPCDWMGNCVLDGLREWAARGRLEARHQLRSQLGLYFHPETGERDNIKGNPANHEPGGPESSGPWATLARSVDGARNESAFSLVEEGLKVHYNAALDYVGRNVVAETSYNIAYPMMAMAVHRRRPDLMPRALQQLEVNRRYLREDDALWLRYFPQTGKRTFLNWSRGVAWYFLGLVRTLELVPVQERPPPLVEEVARMAEWVARHQGPDGLWPCFLKEETVRPDTSGCAGIAAAIAIAIEKGMLGTEHLPPAQRARAGLMSHLTPDGWLRGVSQSNKRESHAMDIQRSQFRVIAPWGMGMLAQLMAALKNIEAPSASATD